MTNIKEKIRRIFRVQYRLSIIIDGKTTNVYSTRANILRKMAKHLAYGADWSIYKSGPLGIGWRMKDYGVVTENRNLKK